MSPTLQPAPDPGVACDKVIIQTFEGDLDTHELRLTATIVTSIAELRERAAAAAGAAPAPLSATPAR